MSWILQEGLQGASMSHNMLSLAVPFFIALMFAEWLWMRRQGQQAYRFADTLTNLGCGMGSQLTGLVFGALNLFAYNWTFANLRVTDLGEHPVLAWTAGLVLVDLVYYLWHRLSHRVSFLWAMHVVHHQSEEYNLSVALRQSWFGSAFSWVLYLPIAVLGVPPVIYATSAVINLLYQFLIHTRAVTTMGPLELVLNTPSHHRVHHGSNVEYLDRNYGGILIIWDRLFGSFTREDSAVRYGLLSPLHSYNPVWANFQAWVALLKQSVGRMPAGVRLQFWLRWPGWQPGDRTDSEAVNRALADGIPGKFPEPVSAPATKIYIAVQFLTALGMTVSIMVWGLFDSWLATALILQVMSSMVLWEKLLNAWRRNMRPEIARNLTFAAFFGAHALWAPRPDHLAMYLALLPLLMAAFLLGLCLLDSTSQPGALTRSPIR